MRLLFLLLLAAGSIPPSTTPSSATGTTTPACLSGQVFSLAEEGCVTLPVLRQKVEPVLTDSVSGLRYGVVLLALVDKQGLVSDVKVIKSPPEDPATGDLVVTAVVDAVRKWRFSPGKDTEGKPVSMYLSIKIHLLTE